MEVVALAYCGRVACSIVVVHRALAMTMFIAVLAALTLYVHRTSPDWGSPNLSPMAIWVGEPVILLFVPLLAFAIDLTMVRRTRFKSWCWRMPIELFVAYPVWMAFWIYIVEFLFLGWVWL